MGVPGRSSWEEVSPSRGLLMHLFHPSRLLAMWALLSWTGCIDNNTWGESQCNQAAFLI